MTVGTQHLHVRWRIIRGIAIYMVQLNGGLARGWIYCAPPTLTASLAECLYKMLELSPPSGLYRKVPTAVSSHHDEVLVSPLGNDPRTYWVRTRCSAN
jgi:hypothetical protein